MCSSSIPIFCLFLNSLLCVFASLREIFLVSCKAHVGQAFQPDNNKHCYGPSCPFGNPALACGGPLPVAFGLLLNYVYSDFGQARKPDLRKMSGGRPNLLFGPFPSERRFEFFLGEELPRGARVFPHDTLEMFASLFDERSERAGEVGRFVGR